MSEAPVAIREAVDADVPALVEFLVKIAEHVAGVAHGHLQPTMEGRQQLDRQMRSALADDQKLVIVAVAADGHVVGMGDIAVWHHVAIWHHPERWCQVSGLIDDVWVEPEFRRQGITRRILAALLDFASAHGIEELVLEYSVSNTEAGAAWSRLGFTPTGVRASARLADVARRL